jgi:DNA-binding FadR family transcriptional regulator
LIHRYGYSRATLREAVRLLEDRHVAQMRRGPGGGLVILPVPGMTIAPRFANHFHAVGIDSGQIDAARAALDIIEAYRGALAEGRDALRMFNQEFRGRLRHASGAGILGARGWTSRYRRPHAADHVLTRLFVACLDALEDRLRVRREMTPVDAFPADSPCMLNSKEGLAHVLARKLEIELRQARAVGMPRLGTEDELCERYGVGREVLRQAIRVLESRGLLDIQRGRAHGLYACASDSACLVEHVIAYLSSICLTWREIDPFARMLTRVVRAVLIAEASLRQRGELSERLDCMNEWTYSPRHIAAHILSEWSMVANPLLIFMEQCVVAYCARSSGAEWKSFDDAELSPLRQLRLYATAAARGDLAQVDRVLDAVCNGIDANRRGTVLSVVGEARTPSAR